MQALIRYDDGHLTIRLGAMAHMAEQVSRFGRRARRRLRPTDSSYDRWESHYLAVLQIDDPRIMQRALEIFLPVLEEAVGPTDDPRIATLYRRASLFYGAVFGISVPTFQESD